MTANEKRRQEWARRIAAFRASGLTMSAWCKANQCTVDQLKYWLYKSKRSSTVPSVTAPTRWVPLAVTDAPSPSASSLVVHIGQVRIELHEGFNPKLLREVVQALGASC